MIKHFFALVIFLIVIVIVQSCTEKRSEARVYDLTCENLLDPDGIGTSEPALSWKINSSKNGTSQKAYQLLVASETDLLTEKEADLWNSGKVISSSQIMVPYRGRDLKSRSICLWKVRIWDENDRVTEWSPVSSFSIGLLDKSDWTASYIRYNEKSENSVSPQFRKSFEISEIPEKTFLFVNSLGYHEVYLNGIKAGNNVLAPAVSQFSDRSQVITYDISAMVKQGRNDIVIWAGKGWYSKGLSGVPFNGPLVRAQIDFLSNNSWTTHVKTDSTWKGRNSGYYDTGTWFPGQFGGEDRKSVV